MSAAAVVCTDSSALLAEHDVVRLGIEVVRVAIALDGERVPEDVDADAFYARLSAGARATTSQPSPAEFAAVYAAAAARGERSVLSIHLDGRVSGVAASAESAAREAPVMSEQILASALPIRAAVGHAAATSELAADALAAALASSGGVVEVERYRVGPAVGAHSGPFSFGAFWWPA